MHTCVRCCLSDPWKPSEHVMGTLYLRSLTLDIKKRTPPTKTMLFQYQSVYHFKGAFWKMFFLKSKTSPVYIGTELGQVLVSSKTEFQTLP